MSLIAGFEDSTRKQLEIIQEQYGIEIRKFITYSTNFVKWIIIFLLLNEETRKMIL
ncbi:hypothetical protein ABE426_20790 [Sphingobacterium faecium]|uniref:hypothetical protein n=1 Tax=Sphingobacterium faecium TaxID=34087 RepID=UPI00320A705B